MSQTFDLDKFIADRKELVDRLYAEAEIEVKSFEDLMKLPVNEEYAKNQLKKQQTEENLKYSNITKEDE